MRTLTPSIVLVVLGVLGGCGDDVAPTCPPDFPVMRDGMCYRSGTGDAGGGMADGSAGTDSAMPGTDSGTPPGDDGGTPIDASNVDCTMLGMHPIVEGGRRFCAVGDCYCRPSDTFEACFAAAFAEICCPVAPDCTRTE